MNSTAIHKRFSIEDNDNNAISFNNSIEIIIFVVICIFFIVFSFLNRITFQRIGI